MNSTEVILRFIGFLAQVSTSFNRVAEFAEKQKTLHSVTTKVSPFKAKPSEYADAGVSIAVFLYRKLANGHLGIGRRKGSTSDMIAFFTPKIALEAYGFEIVESRNLVEWPVSIYRSSPFEIGPEHHFGIR